MSEVRAPIGEWEASPGRAVTRMPVLYSRTLLLRGAVVWLFARLMVMVLYLFIAAGAPAGTAAAFTNGNPLVLSGWTLALTVALMRVDLHRRHEVDLLNNLGVITSRAVILGTVPALVMESAMMLLR